MTQSPRITARGVAIVAAAYVALAAFYALTIAWSGRPESIGDYAASAAGLMPRSLLDYAVKGLLTVPVWWIAVRRLDGRAGAQLAAHVVLCPLWVWAWYVLYRGVAPVLGYFVLENGGESWDVYIPALVYLAQFGGFHAARTVAGVRERAERERVLASRQAELERSARDAQLAALRAQMDPHFLFNTLNTVAASVPPEQGTTRDLVARLAGLVRYALAASRRERVLLREELDFVRDYLALEQERMGARLGAVVEADEAALGVLIPPMTVQPLVENAVRHGLAQGVRGGTVRVEARLDGQAVHVSVSDDGLGPSRPVAELIGVGVGLANTDARLRALFGSGLSLSIPGGDGQARGFEARFAVPLS